MQIDLKSKPDFIDALEHLIIARNMASNDTARFRLLESIVDAVLKEYATDIAEITGALKYVSTSDEYEYAITTVGRQSGYKSVPEGDGWETDFDKGRPNEAWDRFEYHEEFYWKRLKNHEQTNSSISDAEV